MQESPLSGFLPQSLSSVHSYLNDFEPSPAAGGVSPGKYWEPWVPLETSAPWNKVLARVKNMIPFIHTCGIYREKCNYPNWKRPRVQRWLVTTWAGGLWHVSCSWQLYRVQRHHSAPYPLGMMVRLLGGQTIFLSISHQKLLLLKIRAGSNSQYLQEGRFGMVEVNRQADSR